MPRVLVADDDLDFLDAVVQAAEYVGLEVIRATTGDELLEALGNTDPFDAIITDVAMPWSTGLHVMRGARRAGWRQPVIVMSGFYDQDTLHQIAALGEHVSFLVKPFTLRELYAALRGALRPVPAVTAVPDALQAIRVRATVR
jgi:DNA-binding response OmpR family regulator